MLTVLTVSSALVLTLIILVPIRPSRQNVISMPKVRMKPASAAGARRAPAGFLSLGCHSRTRSSLGTQTHRSDALPVHIVRLAIIVRTQVAMGSASMMLSMAARRFEV
jgi:hypothetical protein